ncbi:MAG TPA: tol-pal system-associated acyl-CoA thioesterase [Burkholderiales bacterium]|nr:tol-pal system-associated acyl-CoA thioesterase [Burkholderiales bacterium]
MNNRSESRVAEANRRRAQPFSWPIRVYYEDTDSGGIVYYANYLKFMERARTEWLRALGFTQHDLAARAGVLFVVRSLAIDYVKPSRFDDSLQVSVEPVKVGAGQIMVAQEVRRAAETLASAKVLLACVNAATLRPVRIPQAVLIKTGTIS